MVGIPRALPTGVALAHPPKPRIGRAGLGRAEEERGGERRRAPAKCGGDGKVTQKTTFCLSIFQSKCYVKVLRDPPGGHERE